MIKAIPNRTIGLQKKEIQDGVQESDCKCCNGKGVYTVSLPSKAIKNLKVKSSINVEADCKECEGTGKIKNTIRIIRKNKVTAII